MTAHVPLATRDALNLGSGRRYDPVAVNLDRTGETSPDVIHDLEIVPWPFPDGRFGRVEAVDIIEHLSDPLGAMSEIHRITRPGARVHIVVPHFSSANAYTDLTHRGFFGYRSFDNVTGESVHDYYTDRRFIMRSRRIWFYDDPLSRVVQRLAARNPDLYERYWAWRFPAWFIDFELETGAKVTP
jgi:SAM-dependent methyltransferase